MAVSQSTKESWKINEQMNKVLLDHLTSEMLLAQTPGGGYSVAQHLAHMAEAKKFWSSMVNEVEVSKIPNLVEEQNGKMIAETNLAQIKDVFRQTHKVILQTAESAKDKGKLPYPSLDVFLTHLMVHDAHHRGQIMLALKTADYPLPIDGTFWGLWREG
jgi:uncharacterized damage-inducible protein DinB